VKSFLCYAPNVAVGAHWCFQSINFQTPNASVIGSYCSLQGAFAEWGPWMSYANAQNFRTPISKRFFLRSRKADYVSAAPIAPLLSKELREVFGGRAFWIMLLLTCPLIGYSFFQAVSLYADSSRAAEQSPALAVSLSPFDGILVPTFGALYVAITMLFPFVAIRAVSHEKESGSLRLLSQLPYSLLTIIWIKALAVMIAWSFASLPAISGLGLWMTMAGHVGTAETLTLLFGHAEYGLLVASISLFAAAATESAASAAIVALAFTIGSWALDFTVAGRPGIFEWFARLSLTQILRTFEQGIFSAAVAFNVLVISMGFVTGAAIWLRPDTTRLKFIGSLACAIATGMAVLMAAQVTYSVDVTEDRRNSFSQADEHFLATLNRPLTITVHLSPEDPRYVDVQRNVLSKLQRSMPNVQVRIAKEDSRPGASADSYGLIEYRYDNRTDSSRSTSPREILPLIYALAGEAPPTALPEVDYRGYPLVANAELSFIWFMGVLPLLVIAAWYWSRRPPSYAFASDKGGQR
jgi:ABC-2 family transporter